MPLRKPPSFLPLWVFVLLFKVGAVLHYSVIAVIGARVLPVWVVGLGTASASFLQLALDIPAGFAIDRLGTVRTLRFSTFCFLGAIGVLFLPLTPLVYVASLILSALGWLFFGPSTSAYLLAHAPKKLMGRIDAKISIAMGIGGVISVIGLSLYVTLPTAFIALIMLYPMLGAFAALVLLSRHDAVPVNARHVLRRQAAQTPISAIASLYRQFYPSATLLSFWNFARGSYFGAIWLIIPLLIASGGSPILGVGLAMFDGAVLLIGYFSGWLADRQKKHFLLLGSLSVSAVAALLLGMSLNWLIIPFAFIVSFADEIIIHSLWAILDGKVNKSTANGTLAGAMTFFDDLGWMIGPAVGGILFWWLGPERALMIMSLPMCIAFVFALTVGKRLEDK